MDDNAVGPHVPGPIGRDANQGVEVSSEELRESLGEDFRQILDVNTWLVGEDLSQVYGRLAAEVRAALRLEENARPKIREVLLPKLRDRIGAPPGAGVYRAKLANLERIHRGLLFNAGTEACDGTIQTYDTLPLTISQVGVAVVSYQGNQGTWSQRIYRRDLRTSGGDPTDEMIALLERRAARTSDNQLGRRDRLSDLIQRGLMAYAERAILSRRDGGLALGHGNPAPFEMITGSSSLELMVESTKVIRELVDSHQRFVFVPSEPSDLLLTTIGQALLPLEYAIVDTLKDQINPTVEGGNYRWSYTGTLRWDDDEVKPMGWIRKFRDEVASKVVRGIYRASALGPAQIFYAHVDHADVAAHLVLADSVLQVHRGFPLLLDVAHYTCSGVFGQDTLVGPASVAYADEGAPWRYLSERRSRYG